MKESEKKKPKKNQQLFSPFFWNTEFSFGVMKKIVDEAPIEQEHPPSFPSPTRGEGTRK